jgi:MFS family permease
MLIFVSAAMLALLILPIVDPERLIVDRWRYYLFTGVVTIVAWVTIGYLVGHFVGSRRPLMVLATFTGMTMLPLVIGPVLGWLNARLDHSPATVVTLKVCGYRLHSRNRRIVVRLQSEQPRFPVVEADETTNFIPRPVPAEGTELRAEYHPGTFGIRWIATLGPTGPYKARTR